ncbi:DUF3107 domain-containing protein [uncultured Cellulomonas sp.]|uniref:DUF3107 domain-containing protein n=1 Tax=uncultured Cellulomonas sp. TaxID=189682 RepID=UPI0026170BF6|nr:DUF3107 domain-containing protein [uncultured Cellulomonas sp.]
MDITIGVQNQARELVIESDQTSEEIVGIVSAALEGKPLLELRDTRGRRVLVPTASIGYVEIGSEEKSRVGFGSL